MLSNFLPNFFSLRDMTNFFKEARNIYFQMNIPKKIVRSKLCETQINFAKKYIFLVDLHTKFRGFYFQFLDIKNMVIFFPQKLDN